MSATAATIGAIMAGLNLLGTHRATKKASELAVETAEFNLGMSDIQAGTDDARILGKMFTSMGQADLERTQATQKNIAKNLNSPYANSEGAMMNLQGTQSRIDRNAELMQSNSENRARMQLMDNRTNQAIRDTQTLGRALGTATGASGQMRSGLINSAGMGLTSYGMSQQYTMNPRTGKLDKRGWW